MHYLLDHQWRYFPCLVSSPCFCLQSWTKRLGFSLKEDSIIGERVKYDYCTFLVVVVDIDVDYWQRHGFWILVCSK